MAAPQNIEVRACPFCLMDHMAGALVCPYCGASRRKPNKRFRSYRDVRREDMFITAFAVLAVLLLISILLSVFVYVGGSSRSSSFTTCTRSSPNYPYC